MYHTQDGPLIQSNLALEGLAGVLRKPESEGPLSVICEDPITKEKVRITDPNAVYIKDCGVQVFSVVALANLGYSLRMNHSGVGMHAVVTPEGKTLNARCIGGVISNKACSQDLQTVSLTKQGLSIFTVLIPLHQILGCKKGEVLKQLKNATPPTVGGDKLQYTTPGHNNSGYCIGRFWWYFGHHFTNFSIWSSGFLLGFHVASASCATHATT